MTRFLPVHPTRGQAGATMVLALVLTGCSTSPEAVTERSSDGLATQHAGMVWIPAGEALLGTDDPLAPSIERPLLRIPHHGFWIDRTEVTNAEFAAFVEATGYVTLAERTPDWELLRQQLPPDTVRPPADTLVAGSITFRPERANPNQLDEPNWWVWTPGASWRHPEGPGSSVAGRLDHPVVHIAVEDALAYAAWTSKRLPTEAEWEAAARAGVGDQPFPWGSERQHDGRPMANVWQGRFPAEQLAVDGFAGTAPVGSFPPNRLGLVDMIGNVWEWCTPIGTRTSEPSEDEAIIKGGSFLCAENYCRNDRISARRFLARDTAMAHIGFRCVSEGPAAGQERPRAHHAPSSPRAGRHGP